MPVWLVTGGTGFLGRHLLAALAERGSNRAERHRHRGGENADDSCPVHGLVPLFGVAEAGCPSPTAPAMKTIARIAKM